LAAVGVQHHRPAVPVPPQHRRQPAGRRTAGRPAGPVGTPRRWADACSEPATAPQRRRHRAAAARQKGRVRAVDSDGYYAAARVQSFQKLQRSCAKRLGQIQ
jgi:hypothetical protein